MSREEIEKLANEFSPMMFADVLRYWGEDAAQALTALLSAARDEGRAEGLGGSKLHLEADWGEEDGPVLWWVFPVCEPPYCGTPLDNNWPGYHTHWQRIPLPAPPASQTQEP